MSVAINGTNGVTFNDGSAQSTAATGFGFKNRIINGAMVIDQRNAGASVTPISQQYLCDRFKASLTQASKFTAQQNAGSVTPPTGFKNYQGCTSSSAYSVLSSDLFYIGQAVEGYNVADLAWGTASASPVTLSFWVRSSLTGTFGGSLSNNGTTCYPFAYTINSANTWEYKTVTVNGPTSGVFATDNSTGVLLAFSLGAGSTYTGTAGAWATSSYVASVPGAVSVVGTNGATFYITGVQLEKGSTATSFDVRDYGTELFMCQRYYEKSYDIGTAPATSTIGGVTRFSYAAAASGVFGVADFKVTKRASPTVSTWDQAGNSGRMSFYDAAGFVLTNNLNALASNWGGASRWGFSASTATAGAAGTYTIHWAADAEL